MPTMPHPPPPPRHASNRQAALWVVRMLRHAGHVAYFAGGCVRDQLMHRRPSDHDVATDARPDAVLRLFRRTRSVGKQFGVVLVGVGPHWIEVATFRIDSTYSDGRRPDAIEYGTAEQDARRRDFTINGMFFDPLSRRLIDFVGGQADLKRGVLRAIGIPRERFAEDHLRLLRAVRFAARMDFRIEPRTWAAMKLFASKLPLISPERIAEELEAILTPASRSIAWPLLHRAGLLPYLWPDSRRLAPRAKAVAALLSKLPARVSFDVIVAILALPDADEADRICLALRTSNQVRKSAAWLATHHRELDDPARLSLANLKLLMANPSFADLLHLLRARLAARSAPLSAWRIIRRRANAIAPADVAPPPLLSGHDLAALGLPPGPRYKSILDHVYLAQLNGDLDGPADARAMAQRLLAGQGV